MTFTDHIAALRNIISKGAASKDLRITDRLIGHFLNIARASVIDKYPSQSNWQTICSPLIESSVASVCTDCNLPEACTVLLRSTDPIPSTVTMHKPIVVRTIDGTPLGFGNLSSIKHAQYSLTQSSTSAKGWFIHNQYLYVYSDRKIPLVLIDGIFADPGQISNLPSCSSSAGTTAVTCSNSEQLYPVDAKAIGTIYEMALKNLSNAYRFGEDTRTDARDLAVSVLRNK